MKAAKEKLPYHKIISGKSEPGEIDVISEVPVSITVNGQIWLTFMCTPIDLDALALGFLYNEGVIDAIKEVVSIRVCPQGDNIDIWLEHPADKPLSWIRTSGCTGGITSVKHNNAKIRNKDDIMINGGLIGVKQISKLTAWLFESQDLYRQAGGVHTSALSDGKGILVVAEDIGRHNTLDKIAGRCLIDQINPPRKIIITTGRVSSEMLYKAAKIRASVLISRTSPTTLSITLAEEYGITLIGYARRDRFKIYAHPERILTDEFVPDFNKQVKSR